MVVCEVFDHEIHDGQLDSRPQLEELSSVDPLAFQVDGNGVTCRPGTRGEGEESAAWPPAHRCNLVMLKETDGLSDHGTADSITLHQLCFRSDRLARREASRHYVLEYPSSHIFCQLVGRRPPSRCNRVEHVTARTAPCEVLGLRSDVVTHA